MSVRLKRRINSKIAERKDPGGSFADEPWYVAECPEVGTASQGRRLRGSGNVSASDRSPSSRMSKARWRMGSGTL